MPACSVPDCGKPHVARGLCSKHYQRQRFHGDPLFLKETEKGEAERYLREVVLSYDGDECLFWPFPKDDNGRGRLRKEGRNLIVSRLVCERAHGAPPTPKHQAAHSCGKGHLACVTKGHLSWKTKAENEADKILHGTSNRGERSAHAKLTEAQVREIRLLKGAMSQRGIAKQFGVDESQINRIHHGKRWAWLDEREAA